MKGNEEVGTKQQGEQWSRHREQSVRGPETGDEFEFSSEENFVAEGQSFTSTLGCREWTGRRAR